MAVVVSSPNLESPQLIGVPPAPSSKAADQEEVIGGLIEEWNIQEHIMAFSFDTTASNTGAHNGAVVRLERKLGHACLWCPCQRHIHEVHMKHASDCVFGPTSGPSDQLFKRLQNSWCDTMDHLDYSSLSRFDQDTAEGTFLGEAALDSENFCRRAEAHGTFPREDYKKLV